MKKSLQLLLFYYISISCMAQKDFNVQAELLTKFPFHLFSGGVMIIKGGFNDNKDTLNFILDTGSGGISLDSATAKRLNLKPEPSDVTVKGIAGSRKLSFVKNATLRLPGLNVTKLDFHISDYEILTQSYGIKIDGIIGFSFLRRHIVKINFDDTTISVYSPGKIKYPRRGQLIKPYFTTLPIVPAIVKDDVSIFNSRFFFDTGAGLNILFSEAFTKDSSLFTKGKKFYNSQVEGLGGKAQMSLTMLSNVRFGKYRFKQVPVFIFNDENNVTSYPYLSGLIGNDLLRRFNMVINYPAQEIHIKPNSHFNEKFDYSYSGLNLYMVEGKVEVGEVMKNSPAEKAGIRAGDIILGIDNNFSGSIQRYKEIILTTEHPLSILLTREGVPMIFNLKVIDIKKGK